MRKLHRNRNLVLSLLLLLLASCGKEEAGSFTNLAIVESYLSPGNKIRVTISLKEPFDANATADTSQLNNLNLKVKYAGTWYPLVPAGNGVYVDSAGNVPVIPDSTYYLSFYFSGSTVTSSALIPSKPASVTQSATTISMAQIDLSNPSFTHPPDPVVITFANSGAEYYFLTVQCTDSVKVPVYKDSVPDNDIYSSNPFTGTSIDIQAMRLSYFGNNRIILYHIDPEYAPFFSYQASTSQNYQEPPTNIANGLGIFTGFNTDTLYLKVVKSN
jgi:hypothetical protein